MFVVPSTMQAVMVLNPGPVTGMAVQSVSVPQPQIDEVLIRVRAAGVNRPDVLQRKGKYPPPPGASPLLGLEVAGEIVAGDAAALAQKGWQLGQAVCALLPGGGYAEYAVAALDCCLPVPVGWSWAAAASLPEALFTVWSNVWMRATLQPGESLLVHGGGSGIGVTAVQLARALGHPVYVTAGSAEKCQRCANLGAIPINYQTQDFVTEIKTLTQGAGVSVILDMVAGSYLNRDLQCLADDGRIAVIALLGGVKAEIDASQILLRRLSITGSTLRARPVAFKAMIAQALQARVWPMLAQGLIRPCVDRVFPLSEVAAAHTYMESNQHFGKIVLQVVA